MGSSHSSSQRQVSSPWDQYGYPQSPLPQQSPYYTPPHDYAPSPSFGYGSPKRKLDRKYSRISDDYHSLDEVSSYIYYIYIYTHTHMQLLCIVSLSETTIMDMIEL